jgi:hypothetical protein
MPRRHATRSPDSKMLPPTFDFEPLRDPRVTKVLTETGKVISMTAHMATCRHARKLARAAAFCGPPIQNFSEPQIGS